LRPLLHVVVVQEPTGGFPVARPQRLPHRLGHLAAVPPVHVDPPPPPPPPRPPGRRPPRPRRPPPSTRGGCARPDHPQGAASLPLQGQVPLPPSTIVIPSMASLLPIHA